MQASKASVPAKSRALVVLVLVFAMVASATAGTWWTVATDGTASTSTEALPEAPQVIVDWHNDTGLKVTVNVAGLELAVQSTVGGGFSVVACPQTPLAGEIGTPALPVVRRLFLVPEGAAVEPSFNQGPASVIDLAGAGFANPIIPMQPPINMAPGDLVRDVPLQSGRLRCG